MAAFLLRLFRGTTGRRRRSPNTAIATAAAVPQNELPSPKMGASTVDERPAAVPVPETQAVLLLHGPRQPYDLTEGYPVPALKDSSEVLIRSHVIGLNPIDWKAPDFNFAIPQLPYISGRELAGEVVQLGSDTSRLKPGDRVVVISTDYRDPRKAAYQQYVVAFDFNAVRLPPSISYEGGAVIGIGFAVAALALGVCMGVDFSGVLDGPDLFKLLREVDPEELAQDVRTECLDGIRSHERARPGEWLAIWGGSATSANLTIQLARLAGLRIVAVVDKAKHGLRLSNHKVIKPDLWVDSYDPQRAVEIIRANTGGKVRFGVDTRGKDSAAQLLQALSPGATGTASEKQGSQDGGSPLPTPPATPHDTSFLYAHLIGLTGLPKQTPPEGTMFHTVPIKLFHEVPAVGRALVTWLERLLAAGLVVPPEIIDTEQGLGSVNKALDRMRSGEISGGKLIVKLQ